MSVDLQSSPALLKLLGDPVRWSIVHRLAAEDLCVCHLVEDLGLAQPLVSHHLRVLRQSLLVESTVCANLRVYRVRPDTLQVLGEKIAAMAARAAVTADVEPC